MVEVLNKIFNEDCLVGSEKIPSGSIDLILTDLPYGTVKDAPKNWTVKNEKSHGWDMSIDPKEVYKIANRILRKNGKMVLFSQEPYTTRLITEAIPNIPFSYRMVWEKDSFANALLVNKAPVGMYEDILVFSKTHDTDGLHPLRRYFVMVMDYIGLPKKGIIDRIGQKVDHTFRTGSTQFSLCTEQTYNELVNTYNLEQMEGYKKYDELKKVDEQVKGELYKSVFNLWEGNKYKSNILKYKKDYTGMHPTQKPILLLEDLIKTYSNESDTVVDLTIGSGSTAIACMNTRRNFVGFELDERYYNIASERIANHTTQSELV